ncbi:MAG: S-layer homology domain-containing protein [Leptolyngbya sp. SIO1E4]|nr:S-layer homology domain-containing protein [Leptolyngbya sp. SIO1E4]
MVQRVLYVDPSRGQDSQAGESASQPLKTLSEALRRSQVDTVIHLKAGLYTASSGEQFPLTIPPDCQVIGETGGDRPATILQGSGTVQNPSLGTQAVTCILLEGAALKSVTLVNTQAQGIGVWMAAGHTHLQDVVALKCGQYGGVVLGKALPTVEKSVFEGCGVAGITFLNQGKGQLEQVTCRDNGTGILVQNSASPLVQACRLEQNKTGIQITDTANPVLRSNRVTNNQTYGLHLTGQATADLGQSQAHGNNILRHNGQADINNGSRRSLLTCGNDLLPQRLEGRVELIASELPDASAVPPRLFEQPANVPAVRPPSQPPPERAQPPTPQGSVQFSDMASHWAGPFVDGLAQAGAIAGFEDGTFRPQQRVTRAEFAAFVLASFPDRPEKNPPVQFKDVSRGFWASAALSKAHATGFLTGYPNGTMRPNEPITRIQAIVAVANGLGLTGGRVDEIGIYRDRAQVPSYAVDALATATQRRLVVNYPEPLVLRPLEPMTRGEVSALIYQGRVSLGKSNALESSYVVQPDATQPLFSDLTGHWAADFIRGLADLTLVSGMSDGTFSPNTPMNRAQFAALVVKAFPLAPQREATVFSDVPPSFWGADAIQAAYRGGFMSGFPDQTFGPDNALVRVQTWVALVNGLNWEDPSVNLNPLGRFTDYTTLPRYALQATATAAEKKLILNYPDRTLLRPNQVATRADVCASVYQALVALQRVPAIRSDYSV